MQCGISVRHTEPLANIPKGRLVSWIRGQRDRYAIESIAPSSRHTFTARGAFVDKCFCLFYYLHEAGKSDDPPAVGDVDLSNLSDPGSDIPWTPAPYDSDDDETIKHLFPPAPPAHHPVPMPLLRPPVIVPAVVPAAFSPTQVPDVVMAPATTIATTPAVIQTPPPATTIPPMAVQPSIVVSPPPIPKKYFLQFRRTACSTGRSDRSRTTDRLLFASRLLDHPKGTRCTIRLSSLILVHRRHQEHQ